MISSRASHPTRILRPDWEYNEVTFTAGLKNGEDHPVDVTFEIDPDPVKTTVLASEWDIVIPSDFEMSANSEESVDFILTPSDEDIEPGDYRLEFIVYFDGGDQFDTGILYLEVEAMAVVETTDTSSKQDVDADHGDTVTFSFQLGNNGNEDDIFIVRVSGFDDNWDVKVNNQIYSSSSPPEIAIDHGDDPVTVTIELVPPKSAAGEKFEIIVTVESYNDGHVSQSLTYNIDVQEESDDPSTEEILERMLPLIALVIVLIIMFAVFKKKSARRSE
jgi:hypothetical protein